MSFIMSIRPVLIQNEGEQQRKEITLLYDRGNTSTVLLFLFFFLFFSLRPSPPPLLPAISSNIRNHYQKDIVAFPCVPVSFSLLLLLLFSYCTVQDSLISSSNPLLSMASESTSTNATSQDAASGRIDVVSLIVLVSYPKHYRIFAEKELVLEILPNASDSAFVWFGNYSAEKDEHPLVYMDVLSKMIRLGYQISASTGGGGNPAIGDNMSTHTSHYILIRKRE